MLENISERQGQNICATRAVQNCHPVVGFVLSTICVMQGNFLNRSTCRQNKYFVTFFYIQCTNQSNSDNSLREFQLEIMSFGNSLDSYKYQDYSPSILPKRFLCVLKQLFSFKNKINLTFRFDTQYVVINIPTNLSFKNSFQMTYILWSYAGRNELLRHFLMLSGIYSPFF